MAEIYSYPSATPTTADLLVISKASNRTTRSVTINDVVNLVDTSSFVLGEGTTNTVPLFTGANTIGDSIITQNPSGNLLNINGSVEIEKTGGIDNLRLTSTDATLIGAPVISLFADTAAANGDTIGNIQFNGKNGMVPSSTDFLTYNALFSHIIDKDNNQSILALTGHKGNGSGASKTIANFSVIGTNNLGEGAVLINPSSGYTPSAYNLEVNGDFKVVDEAYFDSNVGIGTNSPDAKLDVAGNIRLKEGNQIYFGATGQIPFWNIGVTNTTTNNFEIIGSGYYSSVRNILLNPPNNGNVGIGTTSPGSKLDVSGNIKANKLTLNNSDTNSSLSLISSSNNAGGNYIHAKKLDSSDQWVLGANSASDNRVVLKQYNDANIIFQNNSGDAVTIASNGNVSIGTTSTISPLTVDGNIRILGNNSLDLGSPTGLPLFSIGTSGSDLVIQDVGSNNAAVIFAITKGIVPRNATTTEINAISNPDPGAMVYNITLNTICFYNGTAWQKVSHTAM